MNVTPWQETVPRRPRTVKCTNKNSLFVRLTVRGRRVLSPARGS